MPDDGKRFGTPTARREFLRYLGAMAALSGAITTGVLDNSSDDTTETEQPREPEQIRGAGFAARHRAYGSRPRHDQATAGGVPRDDADSLVRNSDGIEATATTARVWANGLPYSLPMRGTRQQSWRHQFDAEQITPGEWVEVSELNYGFVTYPPHTVPILRLYAVLDQPRTQRTRSPDEVTLRVVQATSRETVFEVSASNPFRAIRYQEWPLSELDYGTAAPSRSPQAARFVVQAKAEGGHGRIRPSSIGLDMEAL